MSGFVHTPMTLPPVSFGTDPTGSIAVQILGGGAGGGGGASSFLGLTDTPVSYSGQGGKVVAVNTGATGLEFVTAFDGAFASLSGLPTTLAGYGITDAAAASHVHSIAQITGLSGQLTALSDAIDLKADLGHAHAISDVTGLQTALDGKSATGHTHSAADITSGTLAVNRGGTGSTGFITPVNYTAGAANVQSHLSGIDTALGTKAGVSHTHAFSSLTGIPTTLAGYGITDAAALSHGHAAADITSGTLAVNRGGTGSTGFITPVNYTAGSATVQSHLSGIDTALGTKAGVSHTHAASAITSGTIDRARLPTVRNSKTIIIPEPEVGDRFGFYTRRAMTLEQITSVLVGSASPSVGWKLSYTADRSTAGTAVVTAGSTTTSTTAGDVVSSFDNPVIPADRHVVAEITAVSGTVDQIEITPDYTEAA